MALADRLPIGHAGAAERIHAKIETRASDRLEVNHGSQIVDIGRQVVVGPDRGGRFGAVKRQALDA